MFWKYECAFGVILPSSFINLFPCFRCYSGPISIRRDTFAGATHPTVFHPWFLNDAHFFYMVWRCACSFGVIMSLYIQLFTLFQLSGFLVVIWWSGSLWRQLKGSFIPTFLKLCRWFLPCSENMNVLLGWFSHHLLSICFHVFDVIQGQLVLEEIPLRVQLILQFSTHDF